MKPRKLIRVVIGVFTRNVSTIAVGTAAAVLAMSIACGAMAQTRKLVVAQGQNWRTDGFATGPAQVDFGTCLTAGTSANLAAGETFRLKDVGLWQCSNPKAFYLLAEQANSFTFVRFNDGKTRASFYVPPIGAIQPNGWIRFAPITNDADYRLSLNAFPEKIARLFVKFFDAKNKAISEETCDVAPPVTQCSFKTQLSVGSIEITNPGYVTAPPEVYGFLIVSAPDGSAGRTYPF